ncbi:hypothetical protein SteCoe_24192 [Stentor coeruleus]|uniref:Potassium channel domain-containing protein n=1 Tax=Stentor coeruleus TaxID=5963 RepID=A0A1R2BI80_9CILI|nr:hypothetical protein SteCoe_24192 [Stentor coeruleus]
MKIYNLDESNSNDTVFAFSQEKKIHLSTDDSPRKISKSSAFDVPRYNSHMMAAAKKELRNDDTIIAVINFTICTLSFIQHGLFFENNYKSTEFVTYLRIFILSLSISSILWIVRRYEIKLIMLLIRYKVSTRDTVFSTGLYKIMFIEIIFTLVVIPPYVDWTFDIQMLGFTVEYSLSTVLTFVSMIKLYVVVRLFGHYTEYTQEKAEIICSKHAVSANAFFALKCYIKNSPFIGIGSFFFTMSIFSSLAMKLCEEPDRLIDDEYTGSTLSAFWDDMWVIFYTTTTIGYGNIYPFTHLGRVICILACILGNMYLGMLVVSINRKMEHDEGQNLSYAWISREYLKKDIRKNARNAIRKVATLFLLHKKWNSKAISPIKPNGIVVYKGVWVKNDLCHMSEAQYMKKISIYRDLKKSLTILKDLNTQAREVGTSDFDLILQFEDAARIEFPKITKKIREKINKDEVKKSDAIVESFRPMEEASDNIREFTKAMRRKISHAVRRKTLVPSDTQGNVSSPIRSSVRRLTNV